MTITQTIEVPADRLVSFEFRVPEELPAGKATVEVKMTPVIEKPSDQRRAPLVTKDELERILSQPHPHTDALLGILSGMGDITLEQIRDERLAKHTKHLK